MICAIYIANKSYLWNLCGGRLLTGMIAPKSQRSAHKDWASQEATRLKCMGAYLMHLTQKNTSSRWDKFLTIFVLSNLFVTLHMWWLKCYFLFKYPVAGIRKCSAWRPSSSKCMRRVGDPWRSDPKAPSQFLLRHGSWGTCNHSNGLTFFEILGLI